jgi:Zn-dependent protease with chaperone function
MFGTITFNLIFIIIGVFLFILIFALLSYLYFLFFGRSKDHTEILAAGFLYFIFAVVVMIISYFITRFIITKVMNLIKKDINKNNYSLFNSKASAKVLKYSDA